MDAYHFEEIVLNVLEDCLLVFWETDEFMEFVIKFIIEMMISLFLRIMY